MVKARINFIKKKLVKLFSPVEVGTAEAAAVDVDCSGFTRWEPDEGGRS